MDMEAVTAGQKRARAKIKHNNHTLVLFGLMLMYKAAMEFGYVTFLNVNIWTNYPIHFNAAKFLVGLFMVMAIFFLIDHNRQKVSFFMMHFFFIMQIVPLTIIYEMQDEDTLFYLTICISVMICEVLVKGCGDVNIQFEFSKGRKKWIIMGLFAFMILFILYIYHTNGLPTLTALDIYAVYELRSSGIYQISKYVHYLQDIVVKLVFPILLSSFIMKKKWFYAGLTFAVEFVLYLYDGEKSFLFSGIMIILIMVWFMLDKEGERFFHAMYVGLSLVCVLNANEFIAAVYSLIIRRVFFGSALNKFKYYDFFSAHPKVGFAGLFPRWLIPLQNPYGEGYPNGYTYQIGKIYYNAPQMDCNTGFIGEGFLRWGLIGLLIEFLVFAFVLKLLDGFQNKTSFVFTIGISVNVVFGLGDGHLISPLLCGYLTVWILFLLFYKEPGSKMRPERKKYRFHIQIPGIRMARSIR